MSTEFDRSGRTWTGHLIPADHFCTTIAVNVDNEKLSDADFRQFIRNTLPIVDFPAPQIPTYTKEQPK